MPNESHSTPSAIPPALEQVLAHLQRYVAEEDPLEVDESSPRPIAPVLSRLSNAITFRVDPVKPATEALEQEGARTQLARKQEKPLLACSHTDASALVRRGYDIHPLVEAVHLAFSEHWPLRLTPDHIWLTLAQGFSHHLNNHAETLRPKLVAHLGKMVLQARTFRLSTNEDWEQVITTWADDLGDFLSPELHQALVCDFSTTTPLTRLASQVVMMEAVQQYFDYRVYCICGIPRITLAGTVADWEAIQARVQVLRQYDLAWWTDRLEPICAALVQTAQGQPPLRFWQSIYKPEGKYGEKVITGWLADLFPYLLEPNATAISTPTQRNPVLMIPRADLQVEHGIRPSRLPRGLARVPITLESQNGEKRLQLLAGFIGVKVETEEALEPEVGWTVIEPEQLTHHLQHIKQTCPTGPPVTEWDPNVWTAPSYPPDITHMLRHFNSARLYGDTPHWWQIRLCSKYESCRLLGINQGLVRFADLADGRSLYYDLRGGVITAEELWIAVAGPPSEPYVDKQSGEEKLGLRRAHLKVVAKGLEQLFARIEAAEGQYFFDHPDFVPEDTF